MPSGQRRAGRFEEKDTFLDDKIIWLKDRFKEYGKNKGIILSGGNGPFSNAQEEIDCMDKLCNPLNKPGCKDFYDGDCSFEPWTYQSQSEHLVKIFTIAMYHDVPGPAWNLGGLNYNPDAQTFWNGPFTHSRLVNSKVGKKPAYYAYKLMTSKVKGFTSVEKIDDHIYKFIVNEKPIIIAWNNQGKEIDLSKYFSNAKITKPILSLNQIQAESFKTSPKTIKLDNTPIFIEEA